MQHAPKAAMDLRNVNLFAARLKLTALSHFERYDLFGLCTMRADLKEERRTEPDPADLWIPAAEAWIRVAGPQMYQWDREFEYGGSRGYVPSLVPSLSQHAALKVVHQPTHGDPGGGWRLSNGRHGFCRPRWCLWKRKSAEIIESEALSDEVKRIAASAGMRIEEIEVEVSD